MSAPDGSMRSRTRQRAVRPLIALLTAVFVTVAGVPPASAYWTADGSAPATATTSTLVAPVNVAVPATATGDVPVSWTRGTGGTDPEGYYVTRQSAAMTAAACASSPSALIATTGCIDSSVADGEYTYIVTAVYRSWTARSQSSSSVTVVTPILGAAAGFSVLSGTAVVNTGVSSVSGDLGARDSITGLGPQDVGGEIHLGDAQAAQASAALAVAYTDLSQVRPTDVQIVGNLGGRTFTPGVYHITAALALTGTVILNAQNDVNAVFIFRTDAAFNTAAASVVTLANGAVASNVYWVVAGAAGTGANSFLSGNIVAKGAVTLGAATLLIGRALSLDAVTMAAATIRFTDALPPTIAISSGAVTKDTTPTISGVSTAPLSSPVTVTVAGQTLQTSVGVGGTWSVTAAVLTAGVYTVVAKVRDPAGNGASASQALTVEVNPSPLTLGTAATYSALAGTSVVSTGTTTLSGDIGVSPGISVTGFPPGVYAGSAHVNDAAAVAAQGDLLLAIQDATARAPHTEIVGNIGGKTFHVGIHHTAAALELTGIVTLDGEGDTGAVFIFATDAAFNTAAASRVVLINGAQASNVFWVASGAVGTGANSFLSGSVITTEAVTLGAATALTGQVLSRAAVTMAGTIATGISPGVALMAQDETETEPAQVPVASEESPEPSSSSTESPEPPAVSP